MATPFRSAGFWIFLVCLFFSLVNSQVNDMTIVPPVVTADDMSKAASFYQSFISGNSLNIPVMDYNDTSQSPSQDAAAFIYGGCISASRGWLMGNKYPCIGGSIIPDSACYFYAAFKNNCGRTIKNLYFNCMHPKYGSLYVFYPVPYLTTPYGLPSSIGTGRWWEYSCSYNLPIPPGKTTYIVYVSMVKGYLQDLQAEWLSHKFWSTYNTFVTGAWFV